LEKKNKKKKDPVVHGDSCEHGPKGVKEYPVVENSSLVPCSSKHANGDIKKEQPWRWRRGPVEIQRWERNKDVVEMRESKRSRKIRENEGDEGKRERKFIKNAREAHMMGWPSILITLTDEKGRNM